MTISVSSEALLKSGCTGGDQILQEIAEAIEILNESISLFSRFPLVRFSLATQKLHGLAQWRAGNFDHAVERMVHFQNQENRAGHGQGADQKHGNRGAIASCQQTEEDMEHR